MKPDQKQKFKHFYDFLSIFMSVSLCTPVLIVSQMQKGYLCSLSHTNLSPPHSHRVQVLLVQPLTRTEIKKNPKENNLIGLPWVSVNPLTNQLWFEIRLYSSNMTARDMFLWLCVWYCPLKDEVYQLVIETISQTKWYPSHCNYVTDWLFLLNTNSVIEAGAIGSIPI